MWKPPRSCYSYSARSCWPSRRRRGRSPGTGPGPGHEASSALLADPADGVPMEEDGSGRDEDLEDCEMGRGSGAL